jgi:predicted metal-dependent hydrolase
MDHIPVRQLRFDFDRAADPVWSESSPDFAIFINALGIHVPHFERFLVKVMRKWRDELDDPELKADVQAIIGQESHHAFNFLKWTKAMERRYPGLKAIDEHAAGYFEKALTRSRHFQIGFTAGYETFTFLGGMIILNRYEELMGKADPVLRALWIWHQVEEVEHGAVAFDFYQAFYADDEWYRRWMVIYAFVHITAETVRAFAHMIRVEGYYTRPMRALKAWRFCVSFAWDLARAALPVLRRDYHPRRHPICNAAQNPLAVAWRAHVTSGADPEALTEAQIDHMLRATGSGA